LVLPWRHPLGATPRADGTVEFRVWAPRARRVAVRVRGRDHELRDAGLGVREAVVEAAAGDDYVFVLDGTTLPDPSSPRPPAATGGATTASSCRARTARTAGPPASPASSTPRTRPASR